MQFVELDIPGLYRITPKIVEDARGRFVKTFHAGAFSEHGLRDDFREEYYSTSATNVLRGMHFQTPPHDHAKLVYCLQGRVFDAVVDLRVGSPTFGRAFSLELNARDANALYVPQGLAHGFYALEPSTLVYKVTSEYAPEHDGGIHWASTEVAWPGAQPLISERDSRFPRLSEFASPF